MKKRTAILLGLLVLAFVGIADSWYLTQHAYDGTSLSCGIDGLDGCNTVAQSPYSEIQGIPLSVFGVGFYILVFFGAALLLAVRNRLLTQALLLGTGAGAVASVIFILIQVLLIQALCIYCLISAAASFLIFGLSFWLLRGEPKGGAPVVVPWGSGNA